MWPDVLFVATSLAQAWTGTFLPTAKDGLEQCKIGYNCVPIKDCNFNSLEDVAANKPRVCDLHRHKLYTCCRMPGFEVSNNSIGTNETKGETTTIVRGEEATAAPGTRTASSGGHESGFQSAPTVSPDQLTQPRREPESGNTNLFDSQDVDSKSPWKSGNDHPIKTGPHNTEIAVTEDRMSILKNQDESKPGSNDELPLVDNFDFLNELESQIETEKVTPRLPGPEDASDPALTRDNFPGADRRPNDRSTAEQICGTLAPIRRRRQTATAGLVDEVVPDPSSAFRAEVSHGARAAPGRWPWIALLGRLQTDDVTRGGDRADGSGAPRTLWLCGGTLVSRRLVVTAAHCVKNNESQVLVVRLGADRVSAMAEGEETRLVSRVIRHPLYTAFQNDIALLELDAAVTWSDTVRPLCLPRADEVHAEGLPVRVAGWGLLRFGGDPPDALQEAQLQVADTDKCEAAYSPISAFQTSFPGGFNGTKLCAEDAVGRGADACRGDSGGPLVAAGPGDARYQLVAVVSTGAGCGNPQFPGIYTRVTSYVSWINSFLSQETVSNDVEPSNTFGDSL